MDNKNSRWLQVRSKLTEEEIDFLEKTDLKWSDNSDPMKRESVLFLGEHLIAVQSILKPHRYFAPFLEERSNYSRSSAYDYMNFFQRAAGNLPEPVLRRAIARGIDIRGTKTTPLGAYASAIRKNRPPFTSRTSSIDEWWDKIEAIKRKQDLRSNRVLNEKNDDPDEIFKRVSDQIVRGRNKLTPPDQKKFVSNLVHFLHSEDNRKSGTVVNFTPGASAPKSKGALVSRSPKSPSEKEAA